MSASKSRLINRVKNEAALFLALLFAALTLLPLGIWFVGQKVFGDYAGHGFQDFYGTFSGRLRDGDGISWFLVLAPWLAIVALRLTIWGWRKTAKV